MKYIFIIIKAFLVENRFLWGGEPENIGLVFPVLYSAIFGRC